MIDSWDIKPTSSDVCRKQYRIWVGLKPRQKEVSKATVRGGEVQNTYPGSSVAAVVPFVSAKAKP
jgi:hypothetical protein